MKNSFYNLIPEAQIKLMENPMPTKQKTSYTPGPELVKTLRKLENHFQTAVNRNALLPVSWVSLQLEEIKAALKQAGAI